MKSQHFKEQDIQEKNVWKLLQKPLYSILHYKLNFQTRLYKSVVMGVMLHGGIFSPAM